MEVGNTRVDVIVGHAAQLLRPKNEIYRLRWLPLCKRDRSVQGVPRSPHASGLRFFDNGLLSLSNLPKDKIDEMCIFGNLVGHAYGVHEVFLTQPFI